MKLRSMHKEQPENSKDKTGENAQEVKLPGSLRAWVQIPHVEQTE